MKTFFCSLFLLFIAMSTYAQNFAGTYTGVVNGDNTVMVLNTSGNTVNGALKDSGGSHSIEATVNGSQIEGTCYESNLGVAIAFTGLLNGNQLNMTMFIPTLLGDTEPFNFSLTKSGGNNGNIAQNRSQPNNSKGTRDPNLVGAWASESNYSSGYGDNYGAMSSVSILIFNADGTLSNGGGASSVSGGGFSSTNRNGGSGVVPGVTWYTQDNNIYLVSADPAEGTQLLGRYFIAQSGMSITFPNGKKIILSRR